MANSSAIVMYLVGAILGIFGLMFSFTRRKEILDKSKWLFALPLLTVAIFLITWQLGVLTGLGLNPLAAGVTGEGGEGEGLLASVCGNQICEATGYTPAESYTTCPADCPRGGETYQPTASYTTKDKWAGTTTVTGTAYYKVGGAAAGTTAKSNVVVGTEYTYWVDNMTYYVIPKIFTAHEGANDIIADAYQNGTVTLTGYDVTNHENIKNGVYNTTMDANSVANLQFGYTGTAKRSASPFGGVMVIETNNTMSSITCSGPDILTTNPFHLTYSTSATMRTYKTWAYAGTIDDGKGVTHTIDCQYKNGATDVGASTTIAGCMNYVTFIPADYYITNAGDIVLDTEKYANDDTTRVGKNPQGIILTTYWG